MIRFQFVKLSLLVLAVTAGFGCEYHGQQPQVVQSDADAADAETGISGTPDEAGRRHEEALPADDEVIVPASGAVTPPVAMPTPMPMPTPKPTPAPVPVKPVPPAEEEPTVEFVLGNPAVAPRKPIELLAHTPADNADDVDPAVPNITATFGREVSLSGLWDGFYVTCRNATSWTTLQPTFEQIGPLTYEFKPNNSLEQWDECTAHITPKTTNEFGEGVSKETVWTFKIRKEYKMAPPVLNGI